MKAEHSSSPVSDDKNRTRSPVTPEDTSAPVENLAGSGNLTLDSVGEKSANESMPTTPSTPQAQPAIADPLAALTQSFTPKRAVSYLRVWTREQSERGGRKEGFSIPAQRNANKKKAQAVGAIVAKELVERGISGTSTNRPALQEMLRYLEAEQGNVDYVIVHNLDRLAHNHADDITLNQQFNELGTRLVSTTENIDQRPGGILLHSIMSSIAEFYSRNLANEAVKSMNEKMKNGGSVSRAPIGYLNTRTIENGRENRTVTIDEQRAPLVTWAFSSLRQRWALRPDPHCRTHPTRTHHNPNSAAGREACRDPPRPLDAHQPLLHRHHHLQGHRVPRQPHPTHRPRDLRKCSDDPQREDQRRTIDQARPLPQVHTPLQALRVPHGRPGRHEPARRDPPLLLMPRTPLQASSSAQAIADAARVTITVLRDPSGSGCRGSASTRWMCALLPSRRRTIRVPLRESHFGTAAYGVSMARSDADSCALTASRGVV